MPFTNPQKGLHYPGVELLSCASLQFLHGLAVAVGMPIGAGTDHGVVGIGYGHDPGHEGDLPAAPPVRVARTVHALVMRQGGIGDLRHTNHGTQNRCPFTGCS